MHGHLNVKLAKCSQHWAENRFKINNRSCFGISSIPGCVCLDKQN